MRCDYYCYWTGHEALASTAAPSRDPSASANAEGSHSRVGNAVAGCGGSRSRRRVRSSATPLDILPRLRRLPRLFRLPRFPQAARFARFRLLPFNTHPRSAFYLSLDNTPSCPPLVEPRLPRARTCDVAADSGGRAPAVSAGASTIRGTLSASGYSPAAVSPAAVDHVDQVNDHVSTCEWADAAGMDTLDIPQWRYRSASALPTTPPPTPSASIASLTVQICDDASANGGDSSFFEELLREFGAGEGEEAGGQMEEEPGWAEELRIPAEEIAQSEKVAPVVPELDDKWGDYSVKTGIADGREGLMIDAECVFERIQEMGDESAEMGDNAREVADDGAGMGDEGTGMAEDGVEMAGEGAGSRGRRGGDGGRRDGDGGGWSGDGG
ncbi:unnamed protein product [Closterium sp. Naga37s-1]|nr:unnamed protein product [Closterium sp. Naga37s-1]